MCHCCYALVALRVETPHATDARRLHQSQQQVWFREWVSPRSERQLCCFPCNTSAPVETCAQADPFARTAAKVLGCTHLHSPPGERIQAREMQGWLRGHPK